jgi:ABC-type uncharacterized transport system substrate-binding protein
VRWLKTFGWLLISFFLAHIPASATAPTVAVIVPKANEPVSRLYTSIVSGIQTRLPVDVHSINPRTEAHDAMTRVARANPKAIILLGRPVYDQLYSQLTTVSTVPVLVGGVFFRSGTESLEGIDLTIEPLAFLSRVKQLMPNLRRLYTVTTPNTSPMLVDAARRAANTYALTLDIAEGTTPQSEGLAYWTALDRAKSGEDAVWIMQNTSVVDTLFPRLFERSWYRNIPLLSVSGEHAEIGALLSAYPDYEAMGIRLAELALKRLDSKTPQREMVKHLRFLINDRVRAHLGINLPSELQTDVILIR